MYEQMRIEVILGKLINLDLYVREMMQLNLAAMKRIQHHDNHVVGLDTSEEVEESEKEYWENAFDDCEHEVCHRVYCQIDEKRGKPKKHEHR